MTPKTAIDTLRSVGWKDHEIATEVGATQSTIWRLRQGGAQPNYDLGLSLVALAKKEARKKA